MELKLWKQKELVKSSGLKEYLIRENHDLKYQRRCENERNVGEGQNTKKHEV
jgi:hypothetical protein